MANGTGTDPNSLEARLAQVAGSGTATQTPVPQTTQAPQTGVAATPAASAQTPLQDDLANRLAQVASGNAEQFQMPEAPAEKPTTQPYLRGLKTSVGLPEEKTTLQGIAEMPAHIGEALGRAYEKNIDLMGGERTEWYNKGLAAVKSVGDVAAEGVENIPPLVGHALKEYATGVRTGNGKMIAHAFGVLHGLSMQMFSAPEAADIVGEKLARWNPKLAQGMLNRSVGAQVRDVRYGDPSQAFIDEGITSPTTEGRFAAVESRLKELSPELNNQLGASTKILNAHQILEPILADAEKAIDQAIMTKAAKDAAREELNALRENAYKTAGAKGEVSVLTANEIKKRIGEAVNFEKRATPMPDLVENAYRKAYGALKGAVNDAVPDIAELNERVSNLTAARNALRELRMAEKAGRGQGAGFGIVPKAEVVAGRVLPAARETVTPTAGKARAAVIGTQAARPQAELEKEQSPEE